MINQQNQVHVSRNNVHQGEIYRLTQEIERTRQENERIKMKMTDLRRETTQDPVLRKFEAEKAKSSHLERELERFKKENSNLKKKFNEVIDKRNNSTIENYVSSKEIRVTQTEMKSQVNNLRNENSRLKSELDQAVRIQNQEMVPQIEKLRQANFEKDSQINNLKIQIENLNMSLNNSTKGNKSHKAMEEAYHLANQENLRYIETIKNLKERLANKNTTQVIEKNEVYQSKYI